ncbi:uncharacterized protein LOC142227460 [Haematobia irritans]|uniref:uncharacterized protein LOC142227460 n=1 Tax=Haematobia irritans TaxID=7368 RepID=UPI003F4FDCE8
MSLIIDESFEYRHKKFDQSKRPRNDSHNSSDDYDFAHVDIERIDDDDADAEPQYQMTTSNTASLYENYMASNSSATSISPPPCKRARTSSFTSVNSYANFSPLPMTRTQERRTSTPLTSTSLASISPTAAILPKISDETLRSICKYHGNMVRKFPKKERTPKDQERRNKNTIACRMSRRVKKLEHIAIEEQYKEFSQQTFEIIEQAMRSTAYLNELMKLSNAIDNGSTARDIEEKDVKLFALTNENEERSSSSSSSSLSSLSSPSAISNQEKKPFTIAYLVGNKD